MQTQIKNVKSFGELIRRRREELSLTQLEVAKKIGYKNGEFIGMAENDRRRVDLDKMPALANILRLPLHDVVQLYLEDCAPLLANALFDKPFKKSNHVVLTGHEDMMRKLFEIPFEERQLITGMIDTLYARTVESRKAA